ncbi:hypothetical protein MCOR30_007413 [Pyricularia oryzae]|nr:hypothetical protein MCOR30_007413 [Pyricularia oryzae]KAI6491876.1 hypothetical protein MCOR11_006900 [Pyricularia oryzae]
MNGRWVDPDDGNDETVASDGRATDYLLQKWRRQALTALQPPESDRVRTASTVWMDGDE